MIQVHFVPAQPDTPLAQSLLRHLTEADHARLARLRRHEDRDRSLVARAALRGVLARALGVAAAAVPLTASASGQPVLAGTSALHVSVSHSAGVAVIALADVPVGVDVEAHRDMPDGPALAQTWFHPDEARHVSARPDDFLALWTAKEAVVKTLGVGLALGMADFAVAPPTATFARVHAGPDARHADMTVCALAAPSGYHAALSVHTATPGQPRVHHHDMAWLQALARTGVAPSDTERFHGST